MSKSHENEFLPNYKNIMDAFFNLIGYLTLITNFESYSEHYEEYKNILSIISKWAVQYEKKRSLSFLKSNDLIEIYEKLDNLQTYYICNDNMESESEFSDFVLNWMWNLRVLYKNFVESEK